MMAGRSAGRWEAQRLDLRRQAVAGSRAIDRQTAAARPVHCAVEAENAQALRAAEVAPCFLIRREVEVAASCLGRLAAAVPGQAATGHPPDQIHQVHQLREDCRRHRHGLPVAVDQAQAPAADRGCA
jgi:hypothetical protein